MLYSEVFERFREKSPVPVMARATLQNVFSDTEMDRIFREHALHQKEGDLPFSQVVEVMQLAVLKIRPSVCASYQEKKEEIGFSIKSVYNKLSGIDPEVSRAMVVDTASKTRAILEAMDAEVQPTVPGYQTKILDGKHLDRTERRLKPLRMINGAPLPGQALAVLDADRRLISDVIPCEDGHAQERSLLGQVLETVQRHDLWIADRNFATVNFLKGLAWRGAKFVIRRHAHLPLTNLSQKRRVGRIETGMVYEQTATVGGDDGLPVRVITVQLDRPTRDGETEIVLVTNLPKRIDARRIARLYRDRWTIETAFQQVATALNGEIDTLAYPKAALFGFCLALVAYNLLNLVKSAIATAHAKSADDLSTYYLADEIGAAYYGMMIVLPPEYWDTRFSHLSAAQMAEMLLDLGRQVRWDRFRKHRRGPKKPPPDTGSKKHRNHVSTKQILDLA